MDRRTFIKSCFIGSASGVFPQFSYAAIGLSIPLVNTMTVGQRYSVQNSDLFISASQQPVFTSVFKRLRRLQEVVGFGRFSMLGWDEALKFAIRYESIGAFSPQELVFLEELFYTNAAIYGFLGEKVFTNITAVIDHKDVRKIPATGHYLFKGQSEQVYQQICKDIGESVVLTSGVRSVVKQFALFLNKVRRVKGNLTLAARSLAPPGYSFHGVGDFDVGKVGYGLKNFSEEFAKTDEFKRLMQLDYIEIRYARNNVFGVRYEPWHIKTVSS